MQTQYNLNIKDNKIEFTNNTDEFVEVVFAIDDKEVKEGMAYSNQVRGYCYPPGYEKDIKAMKNGEALPFSKRGILKAYIFEGKGNFKKRDYNVPAFIARKLGDQKAMFKRLTDMPSQVLEMQY